ncbi:MAG: hypothetical protein K2H19_01070 [Ruminococcus sp.]|nr:hypothetical protein [Ruminococcus sp.]
MKKVLTILSVLMLTFCLTSCGNKLKISEIPVEKNKILKAYSISDETYTDEDLTVFQDFLLGVRNDCNGKDFDFNNDNRLDVFDMCMLRSEVSGNFSKDDTDILVAYFSCTGNTKQISSYTIDYLNADSFEIIPEIPYTEDDLKYYTDCRADIEQNDPTSRPEIANTIKNMDDYEIVFVGYPIWHGQAPKIIYTFLESYDFSDKIVVPFCTSASSSLGTSATNLYPLTSDSTKWLDGKRFSETATESSVTEWIDTLDLNMNQQEENIMYITVNNTKLSATLSDNSSAEALKNLLFEGDLTINMSDYGNFEKVGNIGTSLPQNNERITTESGDLILYQGNQFSIYYDTNSWSLTRLGKLNNITQAELKKLFGDGDVTVTLSIN